MTAFWSYISHETYCSIWYHLCNFKNVKNTHGGVSLLEELQAQPATLLKLTLLHECFSHFLNWTNGTKLQKASHITENSLKASLTNPTMMFNFSFREIHAFFISNTSSSNARLKLARNQANAKQHPEAELLALKKLFAFFIHVIIQK